MSSNEAIGLVIGALAVIIPLFLTCITPIIKLNKTIQKLNDSIDRLTDSDNSKTEVLMKLDATLTKHDKYLLIDKQRIDNLAHRMEKLDGQEGICDNESRK